MALIWVMIGIYSIFIFITVYMLIMLVKRSSYKIWTFYLLYLVNLCSVLTALLISAFSDYIVFILCNLPNYDDTQIWIPSEITIMLVLLSVIAISLYWILTFFELNSSIRIFSEKTTLSRVKKFRIALLIISFILISFEILLSIPELIGMHDEMNDKLINFAQLGIWVVLIVMYLFNAFSLLKELDTIDEMEDEKKKIKI